MTRLDSREDLRMGEVNAFGAARLRVGIQNERVAGTQLDRAVRESSQTKFRSLEVGENADRARAFGLDGANGVDQTPQCLVISVAHVDAEHVGPGIRQAFYLGFIG